MKHESALKEGNKPSCERCKLGIYDDGDLTCDLLFYDPPVPVPDPVDLASDCEDYTEGQPDPEIIMASYYLNFAVCHVDSEESSRDSEKLCQALKDSYKDWSRKDMMLDLYKQKKQNTKKWQLLCKWMEPVPCKSIESFFKSTGSFFKGDAVWHEDVILECATLKEIRDGDVTYKPVNRDNRLWLISGSKGSALVGEAGNSQVVVLERGDKDSLIKHAKNYKPAFEAKEVSV